MLLFGTVGLPQYSEYTIHNTVDLAKKRLRVRPTMLKYAAVPASPFASLVPQCASSGFLENVNDERKPEEQTKPVLRDSWEAYLGKK